VPARELLRPPRRALTQTSSSGTVTTNVADWTVVLALVIGHWLGRRYGILIVAAAGETLISTTINVLADRPRPITGNGLDPSVPLVVFPHLPS
jgi:hypothetical protein